jgi:hypothetical protein
MRSRRAFLSWVSTGFYAAIFASAHAQDQEPQRQPQSRDQLIANAALLIMPGPTPSKEVEDAASAITPGNSDSIRALVEAVFKFSRFQAPEVMVAVVKQRLIDAQTAYLEGTNAGVSDGAVVDALNALATAFETPDYARVSLLQVQFVRSRLASLMPMLFKPVRPDLQVGEANTAMSPVQGLFLMSIVIDQKTQNANYQLAPVDWDRDMYPRAIAQERAMSELRQRIAAGGVQTRGELRSNLSIEHVDGKLMFLLQQRIAAMSVADGLKLFNETFARLGIQ